MSKEIQITIVEETQERTIYHKQGEKLLNTLISQGGYVLASCGGRGTCGQCSVRFLTHAPLPAHADRAFYTPAQLREGYRLACMARPATDCRIQVCFAKQRAMEAALARGECTIGVGAEAKEGTEIKADSETRAEQKADWDVQKCFVAVDLGTTTIAMQLLDAVSGEKLAVYAALNPQRSYGTDVLSRIEAANNGMREELRQSVHHTLQEGVAALLSQADRQGGTIRPSCIIISGNTTMGHLLMGYDTASLGRYPFTPAANGWIRTTLGDIPMLLMPGISAFVGGDIVSGIYACGMTKREEISLLIDLGTNGEMAIGSKDRILCTSAAAGSAFEGGPTAGIFGADIIKIASDMLKEGIIDETGLLAEPYFNNGYYVKTTGKYDTSVCIRQQDIRTLQEAKAAIYAGIQILTERYGIVLSKIDRVYLAGGFGMKLHIADAEKIGLLPKELHNKITVVSNISLQGACLFGIQENSGSEERERAVQEVEHILKIAEEINLAKQPEFETIYIASLNFPVSV